MKAPGPSGPDGLGSRSGPDGLGSDIHGLEQMFNFLKKLTNKYKIALNY